MTTMNRKLWTWVGVAVGVILLGTLVYGSMTSVQAECQLCVEFRGQRQCRRGAGADQAAAQAAAQRAACAVMTSGMDETIACSRVLPTEVRCTG